MNSIYCMLKLEKADILRYFRMNLSRSEGCEPYLIQLKLEELGIEWYSYYITVSWNICIHPIAKLWYVLPMEMHLFFPKFLPKWIIFIRPTEGHTFISCKKIIFIRPTVRHVFISFWYIIFIRPTDWHTFITYQWIIFVRATDKHVFYLTDGLSSFFLKMDLYLYHSNGSTNMLPMILKYLIDGHAFIFSKISRRWIVQIFPTNGQTSIVQNILQMNSHES